MPMGCIFFQVIDNFYFQTRNLLSVFEKDAMVLRKYSVGLHNCCQRVMSAQNELCAANQALSQHLRSYELQVILTTSVLKVNSIIILYTC